VPEWNTWRTPVSFFLSSTVVGALGVTLAVPEPGLVAIAGIALAAELGMALTAKAVKDGWAGRLRIVLLGLGMLGTLLMVMGVGLAVPVLGIALAGEAVGRWQFYAGRAA
jgi:DMSO reductase anchor subunit